MHICGIALQKCNKCNSCLQFVACCWRTIWDNDLLRIFLSLPRRRQKIKKIQNKYKQFWGLASFKLKRLISFDNIKKYHNSFLLYNYNIILSYLLWYKFQFYDWKTFHFILTFYNLLVSNSVGITTFCNLLLLNKMPSYLVLYNLT